MLPTGRANANTTKANCALCDVSKLNTGRWLLLPRGLERSVNVQEEVDGQKRLVPLAISKSFRQLKPRINELVRSYNMSADMGGCAEVHTFTVPVLWPYLDRTASTGDPVAEHNYWRNPKWLTKDRANQVHELREACMQSIRMQASVDTTFPIEFGRWMATARCVSQIDPYTSLNHMHVHGLAGRRRWIDNYGKIMWATIKMEPDLYRDLALPGEKFDGFGAAIELYDLERALRKGIEIRVNETIMERARNILRVMEEILRDTEDFKHQPLSKQARARAEIAAEGAYQTAKATVLHHLREGHVVSRLSSASPSNSRKSSISSRRGSVQ